MKHLFSHEWYLKNGYPAPNIVGHKKKAFGTFVCGGGSTMGYKLAGFDHIGGVEIDEKVGAIYVKNHDPQFFYNEDIRFFNQRDDLPKELFNLDLLDGSPPCSSFSHSGNKGKDWGKEKKFKEGQKKQRLDDLVFEYIKTIKKLKPKVALLENVKGLIEGNARAYTSRIVNDFQNAGYRVQLFLLNAASMGVPQKRERVFFIGLRNDIDLPVLKLNFKESPIFYETIEEKGIDRKLSQCQYDINCWKNAKKSGIGQSMKKSIGKMGAVSFVYRLMPKRIPLTLNTTSRYFHYKEPGFIVDAEFCKIGSYPLDYNFGNVKAQYLIGMSVPPIMTAQIANQIYKQWLSKIE